MNYFNHRYNEINKSNSCRYLFNAICSTVISVEVNYTFPQKIIWFIVFAVFMVWMIPLWCTSDCWHGAPGRRTANRRSTELAFSQSPVSAISTPTMMMPMQLCHILWGLKMFAFHHTEICNKTSLVLKNNHKYCLHL